MDKNSGVKKMSITLDKAIAEELTTVSGEMNEKKSHIIGKALILYFDMLDEVVADKRLQEFEDGNAKPIPAEKVWKELGL